MLCLVSYCFDFLFNLYAYPVAPLTVIWFTTPVLQVIPNVLRESKTRVRVCVSHLPSNEGKQLPSLFTPPIWQIDLAGDGRQTTSSRRRGSCRSSVPTVFVVLTARGCHVSGFGDRKTCAWSKVGNQFQNDRCALLRSVGRLKSHPPSLLVSRIYDICCRSVRFSAQAKTCTSQGLETRFQFMGMDCIPDRWPHGLWSAVCWFLVEGTLLPSRLNDYDACSGNISSTSG